MECWENGENEIYMRYMYNNILRTIWLIIIVLVSFSVSAHVCSDVTQGGSQYNPGCDPVVITVPGGASQSGGQVSLTINVYNKQTLKGNNGVKCGNPWSGDLSDVAITSMTSSPSCSGCFDMNNPGTNYISLNTGANFNTVVYINSGATPGTYTLRFSVGADQISSGYERYIDVGGIEVTGGGCSDDCTADQCSGTTAYQSCYDIDGDTCNELDNAVTCPSNTPYCTGAGNCVQCTAASQCSDSNPCTTDSCNSNSCGHSNIASGQAITGCTGSTGCSGGSCKCNGAGSCTSQPTCTNPCSPSGGKQCSGNSYQTCTSTNGCLQWSSAVTCSGNTPYCIGAGNCVQCTATSQCTDNICKTPSCSGNVCGETFVANGLTDTGCTGSTGCSGGSCMCNGAGSCTSQPLCTSNCTVLNSMQCSGNSYQTCVDKGAGCLGWNSLTACSGNTPYCTGAGNCVQCTAASQCDDSNQCTIDACSSNACTHTNVASGTSCATGYCSSGQCVQCTATSQCTDNICMSPTCSGNVCGETFVANGLTDTGCTGSTGCTGGSCKCNGVGTCTSQPTCTPECSSGQIQCSGTQKQTCMLSGSCWVWGQATSCPIGQTCCGSGNCQAVACTTANDCGIPSTCKSYTCNYGGSCYASCFLSNLGLGQTDTGCTGNVGCSGGSCKCDGTGVCTSQPTCSNVCTLGQRQCSANSYQICANISGCPIWNTAIACSGNTPYCTGAGNCVQCTAANQCDDSNPCTTDACNSNICSHTTLVDGSTCGTGNCCAGVCDTTIGNSGVSGYASDCRAGPSCVGNSWEYTVSNNGKLCGNFNCRQCSNGYCVTDNSSRCSGTQVCSLGNCSATCTNACSAGQKQCIGTGYQNCFDINNDSCLEWGTIIACADNICYEPSCSSGTCSQVLVANNIPDEACYGSTGCTGGNCSCNGQGSCISFTCNNCSSNQFVNLTNCISNWTCTDWGTCAVSGIRTRTCIDKNGCSVQSGKPSITENCQYQSSGGSGYFGGTNTSTSNNNDINNNDINNNVSGSNNALANSLLNNGTLPNSESANSNISNAKNFSYQNVLIYMKNVSPLIVIVFILVLVLIGGVTYLLVTRKSKVPVMATYNTGNIAVSHKGTNLTQQGTAIHSDVQIYNYLKLYLDKNFTPDQLKQFLVYNGQNPEQIDNLLKILLHNYIKFCISKNFTPEEFKQFLVFRGWKPEQIDEQLRELQLKGPYNN